jgi:hypothetical protein
MGLFDTLNLGKIHQRKLLFVNKINGMTAQINITGVIRTAHGRIILHHTWQKQVLHYKYIMSHEGLQISGLGFTTLSRKRTELEILIQSTTLDGDYIAGGKSKH